MKQKHFQALHQKGYSNTQIAHMKYLADAASKEVAAKNKEEEILLMMAIPLNILVHDYWPKTAKQKAPEFITKVVSLYESVQKGVVSQEELNDLLKEYTEVDFKDIWKRKVEEKRAKGRA